MKPASMLLLLAASGLVLNASCSSDSTPAANTGPTGGLAIGVPDMHCGTPATPVAVDATACMTPETDVGEGGQGGAAGQDGTASQAGSDCNAEHDAAYGDTLYNDSGYDDDCKYAASWSSTPIRLNEDATFTINTQNIASGAPLAAL